ncbi:hypothetical protein [Streptomyces sp. Je 1-369]|nr:hypothetical protein [Streptomyces sp. Je 1-369]WAL96533.1 hypothetical protein NOO62_19850 [Streptomyces sp. Je 1-369]
MLLGICHALDAVGIEVSIPKIGFVACAAISRAELRDRLPPALP